jgi:hypothetical protein
MPEAAAGNLETLADDALAFVESAIIVCAAEIIVISTLPWVSEEKFVAILERNPPDCGSFPKTFALAEQGDCCQVFVL